MRQRFHPTHKTGRISVGSKSSTLFRLRSLFILFPLIFGMLVYGIDLRLRPQVAASATAVAKHAAAEAIQRALTQELVDDDKAYNLVEIKSHVGTQDMTIAEFNVQEMAKLQSSAAARVDNELEHLSMQKIPLPVSQVIGGSIFSFADFSIPIRISIIGTANSSVNANVQSAGVNQTVHILYLNIAVDVNVITPFVTKPVHLETKSPVAYLVFSGPVPDVYYSGNKTFIPPSGAPQ